jgi:uncharacterized protein YbjT (DUF2867 family)
MLRILIVVMCVVSGGAIFAADKPVVLVAGATGETGAHIVRMLNEKGFAVRGLVRNVEKAKAQNGDAAVWVAGDVRESASLSAAMAGASYVISSIGARERDGPNNFENIDWLGNRNLIDAAKAAGVKRMVMVTSGSAGVDSDPKADMFAGRFWKGKAEDYLRASGMDYAIIAPGGLRNFKGAEKGVRLSPRAQYTVGTVARPDVAAVTVECVSNPACGNKTITVINTDAAMPGAWLATLAALPVDTPDTIRGGQKADRIVE